MNGDHTERLSQEGECRKEGEGGILESTSTSARRSSETIKTFARTTSCKGTKEIIRHPTRMPFSIWDNLIPIQNRVVTRFGQLLNS